MSELTSCNYCNLKRIKRAAKAKDYKVTILYDAKWGMGGANVYTHPKYVNIAGLEGGEDGERKNYRSSWMMSIPKECCC